MRTNDGTKAPRITVAKSPILSKVSSHGGTGAALTTEELRAVEAAKALESVRRERAQQAARAARAVAVQAGGSVIRPRRVTEPKTPTFGKPVRIGAAHAGDAYVPLAEAVARAERGLRGDEAASSHGGASAPRHPTEPKPFHFQVDDVLAQHGAAHEVPLSTEERQLRDAQAGGPFRALPYDAASLQRKAGQGIRLVAKKAPTVPQSPALRTAVREDAHQHIGEHNRPDIASREQEDAAPSFRARPMPRFDVAPLVGGRGRSAAPLTTPFSPAFASKARAQAKAAEVPQCNAQKEPEPPAFKARPVPDYAAGAAKDAAHGGAAPRKLTVPHAFALATDSRHEVSAAAERRQREEEEEKERQARVFHARAVMEGVGGTRSGTHHAAPPAPTVLHPFHLASEALHERALDEGTRKAAEEEAREQAGRQFHARPVPAGVLRGPPAAGSGTGLSAAPKRPTTQPSKTAGARRLADRMEKRAAFETQRRERELASDRAKAAALAVEEEKAMAELKRMRREELRFKARPVPSYLRGADAGTGGDDKR